MASRAYNMRSVCTIEVDRYQRTLVAFFVVASEGFIKNRRRKNSDDGDPQQDRADTFKMSEGLKIKGSQKGVPAATGLNF